MDRRLVVPSNDGAALVPAREVGDDRSLCFDPRMQRFAIADFEDPRISDYQNLKDAILGSRCSRFIVEGRGNLEVLLERSPYRPNSILLSERTERSLGPTLDGLAPQCPIYVAPQPVLDRIVGFPIHRGCLAVCDRDPPSNAIELAERLFAEHPAPRIVVLESLRNLDNVGGIFRNAMALGAHGVFLCPETCDPLYRKAIRTSMGGSLCVPFARAAQWPSFLLDLRKLGFRLLALDPDSSSLDLREFEPAQSGPVALLLGTEGAGLSEAALEQADLRLRIAMEEGVDSINVSVAGAIALHALRSSPSAAEKQRG